MSPELGATLAFAVEVVFGLIGYANFGVWVRGVATICRRFAAFSSPTAGW